MVRLRLGTIRHLYRLSLVNIDRTGPCIDLYRERGKGEGENRQFSMGVLGGMWEEERESERGERERERVTLSCSFGSDRQQIGDSYSLQCSSASTNTSRISQIYHLEPSQHTTFSHTHTHTHTQSLPLFLEGLYSCGRHVMKDIVVMEIHQHGNWLSNDQRHPHRRIAVVTTQEFSHEHGQRDLNQGEEEVSSIYNVYINIYTEYSSAGNIFSLTLGVILLLYSSSTSTILVNSNK